MCLPLTKPVSALFGLKFCLSPNISEAELIERVSAFEQAINAFPPVLADRLWVKIHLKTEGEKLRVST